MICSNCGFRNEPGDEFCGSCGKFLEFTGASQNADGQAGAGLPAGAGDQPTNQPTPDSPTTVQPVVPPIPAAAPRSSAAGPAPMGRAPDVICWNCGRRNPAGRAFCMQCGTKLTTDSAVAGAPVAAGVAYRRSATEATDSGGGGRNMLAVGAGLLALLILAGVVGAIFLGVFGGPAATLGPVAGVSPSPSAGASASAAASIASFGASPLLSFGVLPTTPPTFEITFPPPSEPPVTPRPTKTPRPTCDPFGAPQGCRPSPQPSPTAEPTPANCLSSTQADRSVTLTRDFPTRTISSNFAWCVYEITFTNLSAPGATGTLKLYLDNPEFVGPPGNYGMAKIGWPGPAEANIASDFSSSQQYHPLWDYPEGYEVIPGGTTVSFEIVNCGAPDTCNGTVTIEVDRIEAP